MIGGSMETISLAGRDFAVTADTDSSTKRGGFEAELAMNGDGTGRKIMTRVGWALGSVTVSVDQARDDAEYLQSIVDAKQFIDVTATYADGTTWGGRGTIIGEKTFSSVATAESFGMAGPGKWEKQ